MKTKKVKVITYKEKGEYRWRMERNGRIVAVSFEGYSRRDSALKAAQHLTADLNCGRFEFLPE